MGNVLPFDPRLRQNLAIEDPRERALKKLADGLKTHRFTRESERERLARNWHGILKDLKTKHGLKSKREIYAALQHEGSSDDPQKKSRQYEIPDGLTAEELGRRRKQITQKGERWRRLAEQAAKLTGQSPHEFLPRLLEGTSLAPPSTNPTAETPEPIAALLDLANAACRSIARRVDLDNYFKNWSRGLVVYVPAKEDFVPADPDRKYGGNAPFDAATVQDKFYYVGDETRVFDHDALPLPSAIITSQDRLAVAGEASVWKKGTSGEGNEIAERWNVEIRFIREIRLAIGKSKEDDEIAPVLEIRHLTRVYDAKSNREYSFIPFTAGGGGDVQQDLEWAADGNDGNDDAPIHIIFCSGHVLLPAGPKGYQLSCCVEPEEFKTMQGELSRCDHRFEIRPDFIEHHYHLLTEEAIRRLLSHFILGRGMDYSLTLSGPIQRQEPDAYVGGMGKGAALLEQSLLQGTGEGTLYDRLLKSAQKLTSDFDREHRAVVAAITERHREALRQFEE